MKKIGRYEIVGELGRGAMGMVYKAHDPTIGRLVALKILSLAPATAEGVPGAREIFMREARAAGRLSHPNIVTIHDAATDPESQSSYIVMEFVPGRTLEAVLQSSQPYTVEEALTIIRQIVQALEYAHRNQVIHRDLKPSNILLTEDDQVKLTDFGIAKILALEGAARTVAIMGTPSYMSPEQVAGEAVDARSDLFSLGILIYLLLTGRKPFVGDTAAVMFKIVYEDPVPPTAVNLQLHPDLDYIVLRCLAKDREKRYASAREILADLDDFQQGRQPRSKTSLPLYAPPQAEATMARPLPPLVPSAITFNISKKAWVATGITVVFVVLLVVAADLGVGAYRWWTAVPPPPAGIPLAPPAVPSGLPGWPTEASLGYSPLPPLEEGLILAKPDQPGGEALTATSDAAPKPRRVKKPPLKPEAAPLASAAAAKAATAGETTFPPVATLPVRRPPAVAPPQPMVVETATPRPVQLLCEHRLKEGSVAVSSGGQLIFEGKLRGKKKGGFLGIKGGFAGTYSHPITLPPEVHQLSVRVTSTDGSVDLTGTIAAAPPGASPTLHIVVAPQQLKLDWQAAAHRTEE